MPTSSQIDYNRMLAQALLQRGMQTVPGLRGTGQQVGGALTQIASALAGHIVNKKANEQEAALAQAQAQAASQGMGIQQQQAAQNVSQQPPGSATAQNPQQDMSSLRQGTPQPIFTTPVTPPSSTAQASQAKDQQPSVSESQTSVNVSPDKREAFTKLIAPFLQSNDPGVQQKGMQLYDQLMQSRMKSDVASQNNMEEDAFKNKLDQQNLQQQAALQANQPDPDFKKTLIKEGSDEVKAADDLYDKSSQALDHYERIYQLNNDASSSHPSVRFLESHIPTSLLPDAAKEFNAHATALALNSKPAGISRTTDLDVKMMMGMVPSLSNSPEVNKNLTISGIQDSRDLMQYAQFLKKYRMEHGGQTDGAKAVFDQFKTEVPVMSGERKFNMSRQSFNDWLQEKMSGRKQISTQGQKENDIASSILGAK